jgi:hypothetical protein
MKSVGNDALQARSVLLYISTTAWLNLGWSRSFLIPESRLGQQHKLSSNGEMAPVEKKTQQTLSSFFKRPSSFPTPAASQTLSDKN